MRFFNPNLDKRGRLIRALSGTLLCGIALAVFPTSRTAALILLGMAAFLGFEAARGWCALRACGLKTRL